MTHSYECHVSSKYSIKIKSHYHVRKYFPMVRLESQKMHHNEGCIIIVCARHRILCTGSICPFFSFPPICVSMILHMYFHVHPCSMSPPPPPAQTKGVLLCIYAYNHTYQKNKLKQNVPRSLHTCLDTCNNGMFQGQRSRDNQPYAPMRAHVRMETCWPRAHLFICLVYYHNAVYNHTSLFV